MFDLYLTILHAPNCRTLKNCRKVCCLDLGFHRLITFQHSTQTPRCSTFTPRFFVSEFSGTCYPGTNFPGPFSRLPIFLGTFFPGTIFPGFVIELSIDYFLYESSSLKEKIYWLIVEKSFASYNQLKKNY